MKESELSLLALLHRVNQIGCGRFHCDVDGYALTARQCQVLAAIGSNESPSQTTIVHATGIDRSTVADMIRRMTVKKFVKRVRSKEDARAYILSLTDKGKQAVRRGAPEIKKIEDDLLLALPASKRREFVGCLARLSEATA
jgi:DNA-binding MarR family transcriptional regulator